MERKKSTVKELEKKINDLGRLCNGLIMKLSQISDVLNGTNNVAFALLSQTDTLDYEKLKAALKGSNKEFRDSIHKFIADTDEEIQKEINETIKL